MKMFVSLCFVSLVCVLFLGTFAVAAPPVVAVDCAPCDGQVVVKAPYTRVIVGRTPYRALRAPVAYEYRQPQYTIVEEPVPPRIKRGALGFGILADRVVVPRRTSLRVEVR